MSYSSEGHAFAAFLKDLRRNADRSAWTRAQTIGTWLESLIREANEALLAFRTESPAHLDAELGDVLQNWMALAIRNEEAGGAKISTLIDKARTKVRMRKPWIFESGAVLPRTAAEEHAWFTKRKAELRRQGGP